MLDLAPKPVDLHVDRTFAPAVGPLGELMAGDGGARPLRQKAQEVAFALGGGGGVGLPPQLPRAGAAPASGEVRMGEFVFHISRGELKREDETIRLTERERELLRYFAQRPGTPVSRHELAKGADSGGERAVDVQINRLRRKIEHDPANPVYLQTVRGKGYILYPE